MIDLAPLSRFQRPGVARVLVVEDDDGVASFVRTALEDEGYEVASAKHGAAALDVAQQFGPEVILLDLRMPIMDGWAFATQYRRLAARPASIILLSAVRETPEIAEQVHAEAVLAKPIELDELLTTVARFARG